MPLNDTMRRHNLRVVEEKLRSKGVMSVTDNVAIELLSRLAGKVLDWLRDKTYTYRDQTYNLTDSVGCAIYKKGVLVKTFYNSKQASEPNVITYKKSKIIVNGRELLIQALQSGDIASMGDYVLGVFAVAPYGLWVDQSLGDGGDNKRGKGWFSGPNGLKDFTLKEFNRIKNEYIGNK